MRISAPVEGEYLPYQDDYIRRVSSDDVIELLAAQIQTSLALLRPLSEEVVMRRPAADEWTIKEIIGHLIDSERIFTYRALCFARGEQAPLPGFEQDPYVVAGKFNQRTLQDLCDEFATLRQATLALFRTFTPEDITRKGIASDHPSSVRTWIYICAGHEQHHMESIRTVYLGLAA